MPVIQPTAALDKHTNPPLVAGEVFRILYAEKSYTPYVGTYFVPVAGGDGDNTIQYLGTSEVGAGYDSRDVLERYNVKYQVVTLREV
ncbi:hypothetical protein [Pectobacterium phage PPWS2]|uniref:Uncharacterized protein n=1 Tax=Pectobacterium phage PPWS2 TaxID=2153295 RepID=A0A3G9EJ75_9CAUD|nr:hypothetical protein HOU58_gp11 [Pectobacterium phage PPWS2]BBD74643.1 hypothetical protein [Pectobacterium phage PPWS2]